MEDNKIIFQKNKAYLMRYRNIVEHIRVLEEKSFLLEDRIHTVRRPVLSDMPKGGVPITTNDLIIQKAELMERITKLLEKAGKIRSEIMTAIDTLENHKQAEILELYFIDQVSIVDIAGVMDRSTRHIFRLYSSGINAITISDNDYN